MEAHGIVSNKISTCLYIAKGVLETAKRVGLNVSKVAENALVKAIGLMSGADLTAGSQSCPIWRGKCW
jgi:hypothetical protein